MFINFFSRLFKRNQSKSEVNKATLQEILNELNATRSELEQLKKEMFKEIRKCIINMQSDLVEPLIQERNKLLVQISEERLAHRNEIFSLKNDREKK